MVSRVTCLPGIIAFTFLYVEWIVYHRGIPDLSWNSIKRPFPQGIDNNLGVEDRGKDMALI